VLVVGGGPAGTAAAIAAARVGADVLLVERYNPPAPLKLSLSRRVKFRSSPCLTRPLPLNNSIPCAAPMLLL